MQPKDGSAIEQAKKEIQETFGFVPEFYDVVPEPSRASSWGIQRDLQLAETALDNKTKELIGLAVAAHIKCRYCTYFHTEAARAFGASDAELREAVAMGGLTALFSNMLTGGQLDMERFKKEVDRALSYAVQKMKGEPQKPRPTARA